MSLGKSYADVLARLEKQRQLVMCDCDQSMTCPQGRMGSSMRCRIWKETEEEGKPMTEISEAAKVKAEALFSGTVRPCERGRENVARFIQQVSDRP